MSARRASSSLLSAFVELEECVLEACGFYGEVLDTGVRYSRQKRTHVTLDLAPHPATVIAHDRRHTRHRLESRGRAGEPNLHVAFLPRQQRGGLLHRDQLSLADDGHAIADTLDLREHVRREEDRPSFSFQSIEDL